MAAGLHEQPVVVQLAAAGYHESVGGQRLSLRMDMTIRAGELVFVRADRSRTMGLVADACCGMIQPVEGEARFLGRAWSNEDAQSVSALRSAIGRAGRACAWLPFLSVADNVLLAQSHHTRRSRRDILDQAADLANQLGLPGLPLDMPGEIGSADLNRAGVARAFMGRPRLVILEQPDTRDPELTPLLINRILTSLQQGAAVLWVSDRFPGPASDPIGNTKRYRLRRSGVLEALS